MFRDGKGARGREPVVVESEFRAWSAHVRESPFSSGWWGALPIVAASFATLSCLVGGGLWIAGAAHATGAMTIVLTFATVIAAVATFRALAPFAYRRHLGIRVQRKGRVAALAVCGVAACSALVLRARWEEGRIDPVREQWGTVREALGRGDMDAFDRRWNALGSVARSVKREHPAIRDDVDAFVRWCGVEARGVFVEAWPRIATRIDSRSALRAVTRNEALKELPELSRFVDRFFADLRGRAVMTRLHVAAVSAEDSSDAQWLRDAVLDDVREMLPGAQVLLDWPLAGDPPEGVARLDVGVRLSSVELREIAGYQVVWVPVMVAVEFAASGLPPERTLPQEPVFAGPVRVHSRVDGTFDDRELATLVAKSAKWTREEAYAEVEINRARLVRLLRWKLVPGTPDPEPEEPHPRSRPRRPSTR